MIDIVEPFERFVKMFKSPKYRPPRRTIFCMKIATLNYTRVSIQLKLVIF